MATQSRDIKKHKKSIHDVKRYTCDQCDFTSTQSGNLKEHKEAKHKKA